MDQVNDTLTLENTGDEDSGPRALGPSGALAEPHSLSSVWDFSYLGLERFKANTTFGLFLANALFDFSGLFLGNLSRTRLGSSNYADAEQLDCCWVGSLDCIFLENKEVFR